VLVGAYLRVETGIARKCLGGCDDLGQRTPDHAFGHDRLVEVLR
jgi:hypothetical protein